MVPDQSKVIQELRRPFTRHAVNFKIQTVGNKSALVVCYIDSRHVSDRLNVVVPGHWSDEYEEIWTPTGNLAGVRATIYIHGENGRLSRSDVGTIQKKLDKNIANPNEGQYFPLPDPGMGGMKILYSDAFKRAGVKFGIFASGYTVPQMFVPKAQLRDGKYLDDDGEAIQELRHKYQKWLETDKVKNTFGEPLDHGDIELSQGDVEIAE